MIDFEYRAGTLVSPPEIRFTPNTGTTCLTLRLGQSNSRYNDEAGRWERVKEHYFDVVVWPIRRGETTIDLPTIAEAVLEKGSRVVVRGRFETRKWVNKRGDDVYSTEFVADSVFVDALSLGEQAAGGDPGGASGQAGPAPQNSGDTPPWM
ncbi:single-stranded DNA-binding protein [Corynebacterium lujinxingii]|uniref:Single-stranded DNA-binding protein n=1 Tax=Corynebacterium lujinxingii TaxID=2763010 RepID=A0A7H0JWP6_9CORY|nr:single-stranded DNA-binding protein [Corynebacterium lujinxingii]MBC3178124.1 single-stranded DNA-binding protein [Corynebacterium lujinxingii]NNO09636.1 single-stranded DNA-binding protein [Corynebacterium lujinxingii]QNP89462.1 single-stranded DNA-binding protein [Corynebacterium lujinxingii]